MRHPSRFVEHPVGIGQIRVSSRECDVLSVHGLGSCVGVVLFDPIARVGGLAHVQLPESFSLQEENNIAPYAFADKAIPKLLNLLQQREVKKNRLFCFLAGGAAIHDTDNYWKIGKSNQKACLQVLGACGIFPHIKRLGGKEWRTIKLYICTGEVAIQHQGGHCEYVHSQDAGNSVADILQENRLVRDIDDVKRVLNSFTGKPVFESLKLEKKKRIPKSNIVDIKNSKKCLQKFCPTEDNEKLKKNDKKNKRFLPSRNLPTRSLPKNVAEIRKMLSHLVDGNR